MLKHAGLTLALEPTLFTGISHILVHDLYVLLQRISSRSREMTLITRDPTTAAGVVAELPMLLELLRHQRGVLTQVAGEQFGPVQIVHVIL